MAPGWVPHRTCMACREKRPKHELVRFALKPGRELAVDLERGLGGRGAYLCPREHCLGLLKKPERFARPFRLANPPRVEPGLYEDILKAVENNQGGPVARDI